ncbi:MAG: aminodeoxychorismate/anthranilate synthase component II [Saprospiraceae bacterium]|nr:aminodeoxychorismate/anthranilate synthase component II [Saprospiraceae bacterium]
MIEKEVIVIDHEDSFTYNLVGLIENSGASALVLAYKQIPYFDFSEFQHIILSPGPGTPENYPLTIKWIGENFRTKKILGICLGHQILGCYFGLDLIHQDKVVHGKRKHCFRTNENFCTSISSLPSSFKVGLYHSWYVSRPSEDSPLILSCELEDGQTMGLVHRSHSIESYQFHPESYMTEHGHELMQSWLFR